MHKMIDIIERELRPIEESGLSTSNIDRAYKLIDMYANLRDASYKEAKEQMMASGNYSQGYPHGGYAQDYERDSSYKYDRYMDSKRAYRYSRSPESKRNLMNTLEDYMDEFTKKLETMLNDTEFAEERDTIQRYLNKMKNFV